ncbi:sensor domain-containing protein [Mycolicibacterium gadium]|uniref:Sensor domain-containing protein n=1 Tax=Mycolicibacterium gadium TaxID=1794 RepID=A0ABT6GMH8_MYCGU|nr:sensor domain-containing protein [Mycolicibacterium gadium]MDG5482647.1 sensor domain-containing protein [Mycolicibacterium gadium]
MTYIGTAKRRNAAAAVIAASVLLTGCVSTVTGTAIRPPNAGRSDVPPLDESQLDDLVLSIGEVNAVMGSSAMEVTSELDEMTDHSDAVSDTECLGAIYGAEEPVYAGSGWTAVLDQISREEGDDNEHWVEQTVVLYPSADKAQDFFEKSKAQWESCNDSTVSVADGGDAYDWDIENFNAEDALITQVTTQQDAAGWACQHALSPVSNITVEVWACSYSPEDEAATIVTDIVANAAEK